MDLEILPAPEPAIKQARIIKNIRSTPVVIAGGGPAGAATAIALCNEGIACMVINESKKGFTPGESLAPNTSPVLQLLQADHILQSPEYTAYTGNIVVWSKDQERFRYFFSEPYGNGWHLDRVLFEQQLCELASTRGTQWQEGCRISEIKRVNGKMIVTYADGNGLIEVKADWVVDCTGRASVIGKKFGVRKHTLDRLTAFCCMIHQPNGSLSGVSYIEAVEDGWWYAAPVGNERIVINFMTDSDLQDVKAPGLSQWLFEKLQHTKHLRRYIMTGQFPEVHVRTASTSFLEKPSGEGWIAVGDALCSYDPLTSFGITSAIAGSYQAVLAVKGCMDGKSGAMQEYVAVQQDTFNKSVDMLRVQYGLERRWSNNEFWRRRH